MKYQLLEKKELLDIQGTGYIYEHVQTKARICFISSEDDNKTFSISFRTPPTDDTGVAHILEHSVLCGSQKYPIKDPFIELAKGSLNTFLNAMTYSDKTMYPVASVNEKDFHNLVDVYLNAVFYPNIYHTPLTFEQEGWHYELTELEGKVSYKGVVYNEMKGVFSSPEQVLLRKIQQEIFSNHPYTHESGGDPLAIVDLTYEDFISFHKTYYHPSNSYIFYYGDMEIEAELEFLDANYLSKFDYAKIDSEIPLVHQLSEPKVLEVPYPVSDEEDLDDNNYLSYTVLLSETHKTIEGLGFDLLEYLLIDAPGAVLKEALIKEGIGKDVFSSFDGSIREGTFSIIAKNCKKGEESRFIEVIERVLSELVAHGFDEKRVNSALNKFEFRAKEADFGSYPKGVIYCIKAMETWLYDYSPFINFEYSAIFEAVRMELKQGLLQRLIKVYFLENTHKVHLTLVPDLTFSEKKQQQIEARLAEYEATLSKEERIALMAHSQELIDFQDAEESKEDLEKLPLLTLEDISRDKKEFVFNKHLIKDTRLLIHEANANNIVYIKCSFDVSSVNEHQLPVLSILSRLLLNMNTRSRSYSELSDVINGETGGISVNLAVYDHKASTKYFSPRFEIQGKCFVQQLETMYTLIHEIVTQTDFSDVNRLKELINENKSRMQMRLIPSGDSTASLRALSYFSKADSYKERLKGIEFYQELMRWQERSNQDLSELSSLLQRMLREIITSDQLTMGITASDMFLDEVKERTENFIHSLPYEEHNYDKKEIECITTVNEGFKTTSDVQYVVLAGDYAHQGFEYHGSMKVLNTIINLDYLWNSIRVKGGAYGAYSSISRNGVVTFSSYRDPNLESTLQTYHELIEFVETLELDSRELTKYIIGTISTLDRPITCSQENDKMVSLYFSEVTQEDILKNRHQILDTNLQQLKGHRELFQKVLANPYICVIGNEQKIELNKTLFSHVENLK
jgi:presequence protease